MNPEKTKIYPSLNDATVEKVVDDKFQKYTRLQEAQRIYQFFNTELKKYKKLLKRCKTMNNIDRISTGVSALGFSMSATGAITTSAGITFPLSVPTTISGIGLVGSSVLIGVASKYAHSKEERYHTIIEKCNHVLSEYKQTYFNAIEDGKISDNEFKSLNKIYTSYLDFKSNISPIIEKKPSFLDS